MEDKRKAARYLPNPRTQAIFKCVIGDEEITIKSSKMWEISSRGCSFQTDRANFAKLRPGLVGQLQLKLDSHTDKIGDARIVRTWVGGVALSFETSRNVEKYYERAMGKVDSDIAREAIQTDRGGELKGRNEKYGEGEGEKLGAEQDQEEKGKMIDTAVMEPSLEEVSIMASSIPDQPTYTDALGFEPYVTAIAEFLGHEETEPPLTLSVEGEWGSGKSSFMLQLMKKLKGKNGLIVQFSAWRHECEDSLWAAFAESFLIQARKSRFILRRWWGDFILFWRRFSWRDGWVDVVRSVGIKVGVLLIATGLVIIFVKEGYGWFSLVAQQLVGSVTQNTNGWFLAILEKLFGIGGVAGVLAVIAAICYELRKYASNPVEVNLRKYLKSPNYEGRISFIENFHNDFEKIVKAYAGKRKVYVFIDDVDRCVPPKAADLMQAINLLISDNPRLIFIIGMDREKVAAGLAVKHERLLRYIRPEAIGDERIHTDDYSYVNGLDYGYSFIEKFIQLPFSVPRPTKIDIGKLLKEISRRYDKREEAVLGESNLDQTVEGSESEEESITHTEKEEIRERRREVLRLRLAGDSEEVRQVVLMVAHVFDYNPRRIKQFINSFRLRAYIASETGLFDIVEDEKQFPHLTLEQLGKFVAISMKWPSLLADLAKESNILEKLAIVDEKDVKNESEYVQRWFKNEKLMRLVKYVPDRRDAESQNLRSEKYGLGSMDVKKLMEIAPQVRRIGNETFSVVEEVKKEKKDITESNEMANEIPKPFEVQKIDDKTWEVNMDGNRVNVSTHEEAEMIAYMPIEIHKGYDDTPGRPDMGRVTKIVQICDTYGFNTMAIRRLKSWVRDGRGS